MVVFIPGLSESLRAVDKRITNFDTTDAVLSVEAASSARRAQCPRCSAHSSRRHGQYRRKLGAQPCMGRSVSLSVQVRRFKCVNPQCSQATFVEQIDVLALPMQRRTVGLNDACRSMAQALPGDGGVRSASSIRTWTMNRIACPGAVRGDRSSHLRPPHGAPGFGHSR